MNRIKYLFLLIFLVWISACATAPTVTAPAELENANWSAYLTNSVLLNDQATEQRWWTAYQDEQLNQLVAATLEDNLDLKIARSRIHQARASEEVELSVIRPQVGVSGSVTEQQLSETGSLPAGRIPGFEIRQTIYQAGFDAGWELDLFGRNPKRRAIAESRYRNQLELQYDLHLTMVAEVARSYLQLRGLQAQRQILFNMVEQQQRITEAVQTLHDLGEAGSSELNQAQAMLADRQAQLPGFDAQIRILIYRLSVLSGLAPDALSKALMTSRAMPGDHTHSLSQASSDLLRRRADVRHAERQYVIAAEQHKLAKLAIYPTFSLFGGAGPNTIDFDRFSDNESLAFNFGGLIHWPLYSGGRLRAQDKIAEELKLQAEYDYAGTVLQAMQEVESVATRLIESKNELAARRNAHAAQRRSANNMQQRYQAGVSNLIAWLNSEQQAMLSEQAMLATQSQMLQHSVALHKAMGGGWGLFEEYQK